VRATNRSCRPAVQVTVMGATGHAGYSLVFLIAWGQMFGPDRAVALRLLETERAFPAPESVALELALLAGAVAEDLEHDAVAEERLRTTTDELLREPATAQQLVLSW
jgi:hypothetical protein